MKFSLVVLVASALLGCAYAKNLFCYFESWTVYRPGNGKFDVSNIDPTLCTHVAFGFVGLNEDASIHILDGWESDDDGLKGFTHLVSLRESNPDLKILVSMGGWNEGTLIYSDVSADPAKRLALANNILTFLETHEFDGFDLDWEYPARRDSEDRPEDRANFVLLLKAIKSALKTKNYILTAALSGGPGTINTSYIVPEVTEILDFLNVMTYDFHGAFDPYVGHHAPLYASSFDTTEAQKKWNVDGGITEWLELGANASKINMGIGTYGRTFTLSDPKNTSLYAPIEGGGEAQPYTRQEGIMGYNELCELHSDYEYVWDDEQKVPHYISGNQWVGIENTRSVAIKTEYAVSKGLGGFTIWSFDTDDFSNFCGNGTYPLIRTIKKTLSSLNV